MNSRQRKQRNKLLKTVVKIFIEALIEITENTIDENLSQEEFIRQIVILQEELPTLFKEELVK